MTVDVGYAHRPMPGETACGDRVVVVDEAPDNLLVAVIDGLGHGPRAALAADAAGRFVVDNASAPLEELVRDCDQAIHGTRGVAMTVVRIDRVVHSLRHVGIGNVELSAATTQPLCAAALPGIVGSRVRRVRESTFALSHGDLIAIYSDGISSRLDLRSYSRRGAQSIATAILRDHAKDHDDASCAVLAC